MKKSILMRIGRIMLGANWIVGTQFAQFKSIANVFVDVASNFDKASQRTFDQVSRPPIMTE